jgi:hypothetical protein
VKELEATRCHEEVSLSVLNSRALNWYKSTNTDAEGAAGEAEAARYKSTNTDAEGTKVQILTQKALQARPRGRS